MESFWRSHRIIGLYCLQKTYMTGCRGAKNFCHQSLTPFLPHRAVSRWIISRSWTFKVFINKVGKDCLVAWHRNPKYCLSIPMSSGTKKMSSLVGESFGHRSYPNHNSTRPCRSSISSLCQILADDSDQENFRWNVQATAQKGTLKSPMLIRFSFPPSASHIPLRAL